MTNAHAALDTVVSATASGTRTIPLARIGDFALFLLWAVQGTANVIRTTHHVRNGDWLAAAHVAAVTIILFGFAVFFLLRGRASHRDGSALARGVALIGTWSIVVLAAMPLTWRPDWLLSLTTIGLILAYMFVFWALLTLRRNLSIFPEARELVRHGPYRLVRHPLYLAHITCYVLILLPRFGAFPVLVTIAGVACEMLRARNEERVLASVFPEYADYAAATPRFLPGISLRVVRRSYSLPSAVVGR
jgi:protein-S-isoprenylcysteine O-methyltransferase Ste14